MVSLLKRIRNVTLGLGLTASLVLFVAFDLGVIVGSQELIAHGGIEPVAAWVATAFALATVGLCLILLHNRDRPGRGMLALHAIFQTALLAAAAWICSVFTTFAMWTAGCETVTYVDPACVSLGFLQYFILGGTLMGLFLAWRPVFRSTKSH